MLRHYLVILLSLALATSAHADSWHINSASTQSAVVELFVSEGCGLCPPAEKWIDQTSEMHHSVIPLVYHIDYLNDQKGWVDQFAKPEFTKRQQQLATINLYKTVFTPEFFISGEVVHSWREHGKEVIDFVNGYEPEADISLQANMLDKQLDVQVTVDIKRLENREQTKLYLILKEDDIISHVKGGDNYGATFNHQDLVRRLDGPFDLDTSGSTTIHHQLMMSTDWNVNKLHVVAFVQDLSDGFILQGLSLPLEEK